MKVLDWLTGESYYKKLSIKMHRKVDTEDAEMLLTHGVITREEFTERIANIKDRTGRTCEVCKGD